MNEIQHVQAFGYHNGGIICWAVLSASGSVGTHIEKGVFYVPCDCSSPQNDR